MTRSTFHPGSTTSSPTSTRICSEPTGGPPRGTYERFDDLQRELVPYTERLERLLDRELAAFNRLLREEGVPHVVAPEE